MFTETEADSLAALAARVERGDYASDRGTPAPQVSTLALLWYAALFLAASLIVSAVLTIGAFIAFVDMHP